MIELLQGVWGPYLLKTPSGPQSIWLSLKMLPTPFSVEWPHPVNTPVWTSSSGDSLDGLVWIWSPPSLNEPVNLQRVSTPTVWLDWFSKRVSKTFPSFDSSLNCAWEWTCQALLKSEPSVSWIEWPCAQLVWFKFPRALTLQSEASISRGKNALNLVKGACCLMTVTCF